MNTNLRIRLADVSKEPLHQQLKRQLRGRVLRGALSPGDPLPSIRSLARQQRVSVITVQRAYEDLESEGLIEARRGKGFFVCELTAKEKARIAEARFAERAALAIDEARADGLDAERIRKVFEGALVKGEPR